MMDDDPEFNPFWPAVIIVALCAVALTAGLWRFIYLLGGNP